MYAGANNCSGKLAKMRVTPPACPWRGDGRTRPRVTGELTLNDVDGHRRWRSVGRYAAVIALVSPSDGLHEENGRTLERIDGHAGLAVRARRGSAQKGG